MVTPKKEMKRLKNVYDTIADSWTNLRAHPEKPVLDFVDGIKEKGIVLDIGCGNSRNLVPFLRKGFPCIGLDFSRSMIRESKKYLKRKNLKTNFVIGNACDIPLKDGVLDYVLCSRTIPHIPTRGLRLKSIREIKRVSKNNSKILISVWKLWRRIIFKEMIKDLFRKKFEFGDIWVKWRYHGKVYERYYYSYTKKGFEKDLKEVGFKEFKIWEYKGNIWSLVRK